MATTKRRTWLLVANLIALPLLSSPSFGFIFYMNIRGIPLFVLVGWLTAGILGMTLWRKVPGTPAYLAFLLALAAAFFPVVLAWAIALHPLYWPDGATLRDLWPWVRDSVLLGGLFTAGYWLPASLINCLVLRRRAALTRHWS